MIGIVLAGGEATRLPNKPLLPMIDGQPVIRSSIDLFKRSNIEEIITVVPPASPIPAVIKEGGFTIQPKPTGVPHEIGRAHV